MINQADANIQRKFDHINNVVQHNDKVRDYSETSLTPQEKNEISLFHSMKQDPFYKHYLQNHLRQYAEEIDEVGMNFPVSSLEKHDIYEHVKFDRLNLFDFRRNLP